MKKNLLIYMSCLLILMCVPSAILAENNKLSKLLDDPSINTDEWLSIKHVVETYLEEGDIQNTRGMGKISYDHAYRAYEFTDHNFIHQFNAGMSLDELISEQYMWIVPTKNDGQIRVIQEDNDTWTVAGQVLSNGLDDRIVSDDFFAAVNTNRDFIEVYEAKHLISHMYYTEFVYIQTNEGEYLIPNSSRTDFTGFVNGEVYSVSDAITLLQKNYPENINQGDMDGGGARAFPSELWINPLVILAMLSTFVIVLSLVVYTVRRRAKG